MDIHCFRSWFVSRLAKTKLGVSSPHGSRGFSTIEIIVVLAVGGILTAVAGLTMNNGTERAAATSAANTLRSTLQEGRFYAIRRNQPVAVQLVGEDTIVTREDGCEAGSTVISQKDLTSVDAISFDWNGTSGIVWQPNGLVLDCDGAEVDQTILVQLNGRTEESITVERFGRIEQL